MLLWFDLPTRLLLVETLSGPVLCTIILVSQGDPVAGHNPLRTPPSLKEKVE